MCLYWKKLHTCNHPSDRPYIEMCRPGYLSNTVCSNIGEDPDPRPSHFPCWSCIKAEARADVEAAAIEAVNKAREARERAFEARAFKEKQAAEMRAREERIRREARERAIRMREEELRVKRERDDEVQRLRKDGGLWIETGSGKKKRGRKSGSSNGQGIPLLAPPVMKSMDAARDKKENENQNMSPKKERGGTDPGGRAGFWGPKKILSRKENGGGTGFLNPGPNEKTGDAANPSEKK